MQQRGNRLPRRTSHAAMNASGRACLGSHRTMSFVAALLAATLAGCNWIALGYGAARYPTTADGAAANVAISGDIAYVTRAGEGLEVVDLRRARRVGLLPPPPGSGSIDDLAIADGLLFALDARPPGHLGVWSLADPFTPQPLDAPVAVAVGPFSGVSAAGGRVVVSGGTAELSLRTYDAQGRLGPEVDSIDLGRGQPDVLLAGDGRRAFVSTHYWGPYFGVTLLALDGAPPSLRPTASIPLDSYGFTAGGAKPANFPIELAAAAGPVAVVAHARGLAVVSLGTGAPHVISVLDVGVQAVAVDVDGDVAAVVGSVPTPRLVLVDLADPQAPVIRNTVTLPPDSLATSVAISATDVVVAAHREGTLLFRRQDWSLRPEGRST